MGGIIYFKGGAIEPTIIGRTFHAYHSIGPFLLSIAAIAIDIIGHYRVGLHS
jgi:hypothetical protein